MKCSMAEEPHSFRNTKPLSPGLVLFSTEMLELIFISFIEHDTLNVDGGYRLSWTWCALLGSTHFLASNSRHYYHQLSSIIINYHQLSSIIINYHQLSSIIINYHQLSSIIINYHQSSSITKHSSLYLKDPNFPRAVRRASHARGTPF
jgi:hypothetical protein